MNALQPWHIVLVVVVFLILFGSRKLPDAARGLGRSMRIFKSEISEMNNDDKTTDDAAPQPNSRPALDSGDAVRTGTDPAHTSRMQRPA
ncbi:Sec-independent protein translocase subunit TatA [Williamsia muralis]|uniref:Sec-independent protein translocase protein TatA n=1 Tax=Williamsia marianensis TaxID=85044 RepID=A0ABU4EVF6_WILMA|nr:Sec-independent protein translocase subunit TatA [Williamsia muralis]MDV7135233.1 Sec-independent protein translocase subunit TatA [Williamsia muralis]